MVYQMYNAEYRLINTIPEHIHCGETLLLTVVLHNTGAIPWVNFGQHPVRISYHWQTEQGSVAVDDGLRTVLPTSVPPGATLTVDMRVESPPAPGAYHLLIDLVEEGFGWFSEKHVPPLTITVPYLPALPRRATIINGNCVINDAVGNHVIAQLHTLRAAGYQTLLITEFVDDRLPDDVRRYAVAVKLDELRNPVRRLQWVVNHFQSSDIVVVNYSTYYKLALLIKEAQHSAVIFDYHGVTPPELWDSNTTGYADLVLGKKHIDLVQYADYACGHSQFTTNELIQTGLIPPECVSVLPYAVIESAAPSSTSSGNGSGNGSMKKELGLDGNHILLYIGRMARNKRIIDLVEALALVCQHKPNTILLLVGENQFGPYREYAEEVLQRAQELGCQDHVIFTGQVPDLEPYYAMCDLFVTASIHEGFGMPVIEAMAHGKPVVAAATTALPETVGDAGLLFEPQNPANLAAKIVQLLEAKDSMDCIEPPRRQERQDVKIIAFVTPRYGVDIVGGAERLIRGWAEHLACQGYRVEVLTTCVAAMSDWSDYYPPGVEHINGVTVRRFAVDRVDDSVFHEIQQKAIRGEYVGYREEQRFLHNNLQSSALNQYLRDHAPNLRCAIFAPYLFGTTYWGMQAIPDKAIIVPCLHDEPVTYFSVFRELLESATGIFFNTQAECDFATNTLGVVNPYRAVVGYGFDIATHPTGDGQAFRTRYNLPEHIVLYSGRLEEGKNVPLLLDYFVRYKEEQPGPLALVLVGSEGVPIPHHPDIIYLGMLPEEDMPHAFASALVLCQPSLNESFSIVIMESWLQKRPVLVHEHCTVTRNHVQDSGGGATFHDYARFRDALNHLVHNPADAATLGQKGYTYVAHQYAWDVVTERIIQGIEAFTTPRSEYSRLAQRGIVRSLAFTHERFHDAFLDLVEQAQGTLEHHLDGDYQQHLQQLTQVGMPEYTVRSNLPIVGPLVAWARKQMTAHMKEPYLDAIVERQERFNTALLQTLLPALEQSRYEQRRLKREVGILRERLAKREDLDNSR